jgi:hypothetical protein
MKWIMFIIILAPCYALETIICERYTGSYDCQVYSPHEEYLEDVIHVTESEGMNTDISQNSEVGEQKEEDNRQDFAPLIFPIYKLW